MAFGFGFGMPRSFATPFSPASLFATGAPGTWYDPSDINLNWRYNLLTYTEQFDNAAWTKSSTSISANSAVAPDGTTTADSLIEDNTLNSHRVQQSVSTASGVVHAQVVYAKKNTRSWIALYVSGANVGRYFDLTNGITGSTLVGAPITSTITSAGNDWYKCEITFTATATSMPQIYLATSDGVNNYTGNGTSGIYIWGASLTTAANASLPYQQIVTPEISYLNYQSQPILYQDSAGTTPVTAVEQPVGLMLDKSQGLVLGPQLVTNGDFSNGTTGWSANGTATPTLSVVSGELRVSISSAALQIRAVQTLTLISGKTYKVTGITRRVVGDNTFLRITSSSDGSSAGQVAFSVNAATSNTEVQLVFTATAATLYLVLGVGVASGTANLDGFFDNISVRELPGNHAFQSTAASRPVLSARYNLLERTEDFTNAYWGKNASVTVSQAGGIGTLSVPSSIGSGTNIFFKQSISPFSNGATALSRIEVRCTTGQRISLASDSGLTTVVMTPEWQTITLTSTIASGGFHQFYIRTVEASQTYSFDIRFPDLRISNNGTTQPAYQRVNTATDYNTVGFLPYLKFDGVDDSLSTNSINFTSTDKMSVFAGVRKLSDTASAILVDLSAQTGSESGVFGTWAPFTATIEYAFQSRGTAVSGSTQRLQIDNSAYAAPVTNTITGLFDIPNDSTAARINGVSAGAATGEQGTGNYGNYPLYIGRRGGSSLPFNGQLYSMIIVGKAVTAGELSSTETYTASKTGVVLA